MLHTTTEIGAQLGIRRETVARLMQQLGVTPEHRSRNVALYSAEQVEQLRSYMNEPQTGRGWRRGTPRGKRGTK